MNKAFEITNKLLHEDIIVKDVLPSTVERIVAAILGKQSNEILWCIDNGEERKIAHSHQIAGFLSETTTNLIWSLEYVRRRG